MYFVFLMLLIVCQQTAKAGDKLNNGWGEYWTPWLSPITKQKAVAKPEKLKRDLAQALPRVEAIQGNRHQKINFVQDVLGISEADFAEIPAENRRQEFDRLCRENHFESGHFQQSSLATLRDHVHEATEPGSFHVIVGDGPLEPGHELVYQQVDIGSLQASWGRHCEESGKRLTVVVASNSNCLETVNEHDVPDNITRYIHDHTQGPAASISAAPGTLLRHYFGINGEQQGAGNQLNLLDELLAAANNELGFEVQVPNGYLKLPANAAHLAMLADFFEANQGLIKVGIHTDVSVSHGLTTGNQQYTLAAADRPLINQIFCAALDIGQGTNARTANSIRIARVLLSAQIEAAILAAQANNTDILVIPLLGCGAFGNEISWLIDALEHSQALIIASGMRVVLNLFSGDQLNQPLHRRLQQLVHDTNGSYVQYGQKETRLTVS